MTTDLEMKRDPSVLTGITVGAVSLVLVVLIVLGLETLYYRTAEAEQWRKTVDRQPAELIELRESQRRLLEGYRLVDEALGIAAVPIERAMEMVVADQGRPVSAPPSPPPPPPGSTGDEEAVQDGAGQTAGPGSTGSGEVP